MLKQMPNDLARLLEWSKHPEIPPDARKRIEDLYRREYGIEGKALADEIEVFAEGYHTCVSSGGLTDQFKNHVKAGVTGYEKALRRSVRLVRFVHRVISSKGLNPSRIDWGVVWLEYNKANPKAQMKSPAVLKASYYRAIADPRVKERLFDREYSEYGESVKEIILLEENPAFAQQTMKAALYDLAQEYGEVVVSGTVTAIRANKGLPLDKGSQVSFRKGGTTK